MAGQFEGAEVIGGVVGEVGIDAKGVDAGVDHVKAKLDSLKPNFQALESMARKVFIGLLGIGGFAVKAFADAEQADTKLRASLQSSLSQAEKNKTALQQVGEQLAKLKDKSITVAVKQGQASGVTRGAGDIPKIGNLVAADQIKNIDAVLERLKNFATALSKVTVYDDESIKEQMAFAMQLGVTSNNVEGVTKAGVGLAQLFGGDLKAGVEAAAKASEGHFKQLNKLIPGLDQCSTNAEKWARVIGYSNDLEKQAEAQSDTLSGSMTKLWHEVGEVGEVFGAVLAPQVQQVTSFLSALAVKLQNLTPEQAQQITHWAEVAAAIAGVIILGPRIVGFANGITSTFAGVFRLLTMGVGTVVKLGSGLVSVFGSVISGIMGLAAGALSAIGGLLAGAASLVAGLASTVASVVGLVASGVAGLLGVVGTVVGALTSGIGTAVGILGSAVGVIGSLVSGLAGVIASGFTALTAAVVEAGGVFAFLTGPIGITVAVLGAVAVAAGIAIHSMGGFTAVLDAIKGAFSSTFTAARNIVGSAVDSMSNMFAGWMKYVGDVFGYVSDVAGSAFSGVAGIATGLYTFLVSGAQAAFGAMANGFMNIGSAFMGIADVMFGSWRGFVQGGITLWHQFADMFADIWLTIKSATINVWEDLKAKFPEVVYVWGGAIAKFATQAWDTMKSLGASIKNLWTEIVNYIADKLAEAKVKSQAMDDVRAKYEGKTLTAQDANALAAGEVQQRQTAAVRQANTEAADKGLTGKAEADYVDQRVQQLFTQDQRKEVTDRYQQQYAGKKLDDGQLQSLIDKETNYRLDSLRQQRDAEDKAREDEYNARLSAINAEEKARIAAIDKWSQDGMKKTPLDHARERDAALKKADEDRAALEAERAKQVAADMAKLQSMPKLSDAAKALYDDIQKHLGLGDISAFIDDIKRQADDLKRQAADTVNNVKPPGMNPNIVDANAGKAGKTIEEAFKESLRKQLMPAALMSQEEAKKKRDAESAKKQADADRKADIAARKENTKVTNDLNDNVRTLNDTLQKGVVGTFA